MVSGSSAVWRYVKSKSFLMVLSNLFVELSEGSAACPSSCSMFSKKFLVVHCIHMNIQILFCLNIF